MSNQRNGFRAVLKKNFVKLRWKPGAVSMVLFSKGRNGIHDVFMDGIDLKDG